MKFHLALSNVESSFLCFSPTVCVCLNHTTMSAPLSAELKLRDYKGGISQCGRAYEWQECKAWMVSQVQCGFVSGLSAWVGTWKQVLNHRLTVMFSFQWWVFSKTFQACTSYVHCVSGLSAAVRAWQEVPDVDGFIGPVCSVGCEPVALLAAAWNVPVISFSCSSSSLSDMDQYPTFA